jgi:hypothetical protein
VSRGVRGGDRRFAPWAMLTALIFGVLANLAFADERRSPAVAQEFQWEHPCPSTGLRTGACPGYVKDHVVPLACGGPDDPSNLQWQTVAEAAAKDKWERRDCAHGSGNGYLYGHPNGHDPDGIVLRGRSTRPN